MYNFYCDTSVMQISRSETCAIYLLQSKRDGENRWAVPVNTASLLCSLEGA